MADYSTALSALSYLSGLGAVIFLHALISLFGETGQGQDRGQV
jgi:hypothetical protein